MASRMPHRRELDSYQRFLPRSLVDSRILYMPRRKKDIDEKKRKRSLRTQFGNLHGFLGEEEPRKRKVMKHNVIHAGSVPKTTESANNKPLTNNLSDRQSLADFATGTPSDNESNNSNQPDSGKKHPMEDDPITKIWTIYCKTFRRATEQIKHLNVREGPNETVFSVTTAHQGTITYIDGTITKYTYILLLTSDVLGYILPIISLFTMIKNNGYRILYLSARAIGQVHVTRKYLRLVKQGDLSWIHNTLDTAIESMYSKQSLIVDFVFLFPPFGGQNPTSVDKMSF
ncbi:hypothetical protein GHT06_012977 [Daphnia sinensis]|uniref:LNS2/PITP domain-containing protein n=1 Tax=Daphnia sinensis TaxID=1820382 RepID=A0AAD5LGV1_9CRUS|nr:hypothetical protein GHT06_012977 [Daphnia sinensis]